MDRRHFMAAIGTGLAFSQAGALAQSTDSNAAPDILDRLIHAPLLKAFYNTKPQGHVDANALVGLNIAKKTLVEDQRLGTEWILRGIVSGHPDWITRGWQMLDVGLSWQLPDGSFQPSYFHSSSLYLESVARACLLDGSHTEKYADGLKRGCDWLLLPKNLDLGLEQNAPYTHRWYILAACFGQAGALLGDQELIARGNSFAVTGLDKQRADGVNPELGGFDCSYQFVGPLFAYRYYPWASSSIQKRIRRMARAAIQLGISKIQDDGSIDMSGSTRNGKEIASGILKRPNQTEIFQVLAFADLLDPHDEWRAAGIRLAKHAGFPVRPDSINVAMQSATMPVDW